MSRRRRAALAAAAGASLLVLLGGVAWISVTALGLERAGEAARRQATLEEGVRLALWRMDSAVAPITAVEAARPAAAYRAFARPPGALGAGAADVLVPSPLLSEPAPFVRLHFQMGPGGELSSPEAPEGDDRDRAARLLPGARLAAARARLADLRRVLGTRAASAALADVSGWLRAQKAPARGGLASARAAAPRSFGLSSQLERNAAEWSMRQAVSDNSAALDGRELPEAAAPAPRPMRAVWIAGELLLVRSAMVDGASVVQGCWLDWPALRASLLEGVADLLPEAGLEPVASSAAAPEGRRLASLPARLEPGPVPTGAQPGARPTRLVLGAAWAGVLLATLAMAALLAGAVVLGERRAAFVSAVTHELRTPLTTLRTYTEMLASGRLADEGKRRRYLETLRREAERLGHLVDNVLLFARVERGAASRLELVEVPALLERARERLAERAAQAGLELVLDPGPAARVRANAAAVEQVLFNLVDNACKYAAAATDRRVHVEARAAGGAAAVTVRDHGPGVAAEARPRLFRPFARAAEHAAGSAPGVGLGLALCRRLARAMRGDLRLVESEEGAVFELSLPSA